MGFCSSSSSSPRHGFHLDCQSCGGGATTAVGGIEDSKHFAGILREYKRRHKGHKYNLEQSFHAAELAHVTQSQTSRQTTTSATFADFTNNSIAAASFTAGKKYLISVTAQLDSSSATSAARIQMVHGTTAFTDSDGRWGPNSTTGRVNYFWWTVFTQPGGGAEDIKAQIANGTAGTTTGIDNFSLICIKLSDDLTEDTGSGGDWKTNEVSATTSLTQSDSSSNNASVTITPAVANNHWLVLTKSRLAAAAITRSSASRIVRSGEASSTGPFTQWEHAVNTDTPVYSLARVFTLGAASNTFEEKSFSVTANSGSRTYSGVFVLNLSKLAVTADSYDDSSVTELGADTTPFQTQVASVSIQPAVQGDVWALGLMTVDQNATGITFKARMQLDNSTSTDIPATSTTDSYNFWNTKDATDEPIWVGQGMISALSTSSHTVDLDASVSAATAGRGARAKSLFAATMEISAGQNYIKQVTESQDITEAFSRGFGKQTAESAVDITEATSKSQALSKNTEESQEITEALKHLKPWYEELEYDLAYYESLATPDKKRKVDESLDIAEQLRKLQEDYDVNDYDIDDYDTLAGGVDYKKIAGEAVDLTEATAMLRNRIQEISETIWITEAIARLTNRTRTVDELLHINEALSTYRTLARIVDESVDVNELISYLRNLARIVAEGDINIDETQAKLSDKTRELLETINLDEAVDKLVTSQEVAITKIVDEGQLWITEAINRLSGLNRELNETVNIDEAVSRLLTVIRIVDEGPINIDEAVAFARILVRAVDESTDINETVLRLRTLTRETTEGAIDIADSIIQLIGIVREVTPAEAVDITEAVEKIVALPPEVLQQADELVHVNEAINILVNKLRVVDEAVEISEAVSYMRELTRMVDEGATNVEELVSKVSSFTRQVNETIDITEALLKVPGIVKVVGGVSLQGPGGDFVATDFVTADFVTGGAPYMEEVTAITEAVEKILAVPPANIQVAQEGAVEIAEAIYYLSNKFRVVDEAIDVNESINKIADRIRTVSEGDINVGEAYDIARNLVRIQDEQMHVNEAIEKLQSLTRITSEGATDILEAATRNLSLVRVADETTHLIESITTLMNKIRIIDESTDITELAEAIVTAVANQVIQEITENLDINEALASLKITAKTAVVEEGNLDVNESTAFMRDLARAVSEDVHLVEALNRIGAFARSINEDVWLADLNERIRTLAREITETQHITEAVSQIKGLSAIVDELVHLSDTQVSATGKAIVIEELAEIADSILGILELNVAEPPILGFAGYGRYPYVRYKPRKQKLEQPITPRRITPEFPARFTVHKLVRSRYSIIESAKSYRTKLELNALLDRLKPNYIIQKARTIKPQITQYDKISHNPKVPYREPKTGIILLKQPVSKIVAASYNTKTSITKILSAHYQTKVSCSRTILSAHRQYAQTSKFLDAKYKIKSGQDYNQLMQIKQLLELREALDLISAM